MWNLMTSEETGALLGKSPRWVIRNIGVLGIPAVKVGRHWRFRRDEIERWLEMNRAA
jgi:excisionase family DNA binding protein